MFSGKINELKSKLSVGNSYKINCNKPEVAATVLTEKFGLKNMTIEAANLIFDIESKEIIPLLIKTLVHEDIQLFEISKNESTLESLYLTLTK